MFRKRSKDKGNDLKGLNYHHVLGAAPAPLRDELIDQRTPAVDFTNILRAAFAQILLCQTITNPYSKHTKASQNTFVWKRSLNVGKLTPIVRAELLIPHDAEHYAGDLISSSNDQFLLDLFQKSLTIFI